MRISVASGKGGTGKTMVATSLALSLAAITPGLPWLRQDLPWLRQDLPWLRQDLPWLRQDLPWLRQDLPWLRQDLPWLRQDLPPLFLDCDVEAPNADLFLSPALTDKQEVNLLIPSVDDEKCIYCGKCAEVCQYHAIAVLGKKTLVFPQLCHGCGSCAAVCPEKAIHEIPQRLGVLERGPATGNIPFARGILDVGEPMAVPIISQLKKWATPAPGQVVIVDVPPGTSCPVVESIRGSDYVILVTEPTPFGLHDLRLAVEVAQELAIPKGVIINRENGEYRPLTDFCNEKGLDVLMHIPFDRKIAEGIALGKALVEIYPEYWDYFTSVFAHILSKNPQAAR